MKMRKYCCHHFRSGHEIEQTMGLNIRIVKLSEKDVFDKKELKYPYRVFITEGYEKDQKNVKISLIKYCPYCGSKLSRWYKTDEYVNEDDHSFASI